MILLGLMGVALGCEEAVDADAFLAEVDGAWQKAVQGMNSTARDAVIELEPKLGCLSRPLAAPEVARFHRIEAIKALHEGDTRAANHAALAASRLAPKAAPTWAEALPAYGSLQAEAGTASEGFATSLAARVYVDGTVSSSRPIGLPAVVQIFAPDGAPVAGGWVAGTDPLPDWVAFPPVDCDEEVNVDRIVSDVGRAGSAYTELDLDGFEAALHAVASGLPCANGRVGLTQAAAIHRLEGIRLFTHGAESSAIRSFQQANTLDPGYAPPQALIPPGSTLADLYDLAKRSPPSPWLNVRVPDGLRMVVDGLEASQRPAAAPSIVQVATPSGQILLSRYVPPGASLPDLDMLTRTAQSAERERLSPAMRLYRDEGQRHLKRVRRTRLLVAGIATLTASGVLYVDNALANLEYRDPETPHTRLGALQRRANATATASSLLVITGTGILVASAFVQDVD